MWGVRSSALEQMMERKKNASDRGSYMSTS